MYVILIAIGMHTKPCIASQALISQLATGCTAFNWLQYKLYIARKESF